MKKIQGEAPSMHLRRRVAIVANPAAGRMRHDRSRGRLNGISGALSAPVLGLDCHSAEEFRDCVAEASRDFSVLLVAGGDGTFTDALNSERGNAVLGYLPFGTGNALASALGLSPAWKDYLHRVREGAGTKVGVMLVNGERKAFFASVGIDALTVRKYNEMKIGVGKGLARYALAFGAALRDYRPVNLEIRNGRSARSVRRSLTTIISKHPFYGYGLRVNRGELTDPYLHMRTFNLSRARTLKALAAAAFKITPRSGVFHKGTSFTLSCDTEQAMQLDGEWGGTGREFSFEVLPGNLRMIM